MTAVVEGRINKNQRWIFGSTAWLPLAVLVVVWAIIWLSDLKRVIWGEKRESEQNNPQFSSWVSSTHRVSLPLVGSPLWFLLHLRRRAHIPHERGGAPDGLEFREGEFKW